MIKRVNKENSGEHVKSWKFLAKLRECEEICKKWESPDEIGRLGTYAVETGCTKFIIHKVFITLIVTPHSPGQEDLK